MIPTNPTERDTYKQSLIKREETLKAQILANQESPALLAELRKDYRAAVDELDLFYSDERAGENE
jgi:hypothetical protein